MKKFLLLLILPALGANAQSAISLRTEPINGTEIVILPTCGNLLKMMGATTIQFAAAMKRYNYLADAKAPETFVANGDQKKFISTVTKQKDAIILSLSQVTAYNSLISLEMSNLYPDAKLSTDADGNKSYSFTVKNATGTHKYKLAPALKDEYGDIISVLQLMPD